MARGGEQGVAIRFDRIGVRFPTPDGGVEALRDFSLEVPADGLTAVIGPNGCGKSTVLRVAAGLVAPSAGSVQVGGTTPAAGDGRVGLGFQQPRLVPWRSTLDNVALPLELGGTPVAERHGRARATLARVGLEAAGRLRPAQLSGGMQQRAALARSLITDPPVLLLDEPFSALDALTREAFDAELERLWLAEPRTVVLVTHSVNEAVQLADRIVVMTAGPGHVARVVEVDLARPRSAHLIGERHATEVASEVRAVLEQVHPPELRPWLAVEAAR
jgi:NitT/TauT family transport system ATP-binding protein